MKLRNISVKGIERDRQIRVFLCGEDGSAIAPEDYDLEVGSVLLDLAWALNEDVQDHGGSVKRHFSPGGPLQPGFGEAHDMWLPPAIYIVASLSSAGAVAAFSRALIGYLRERRSDVRLNVGDIEIEIKRVKDPESLLPKITAAINDMAPWVDVAEQGQSTKDVASNPPRPLNRSKEDLG